MNFAGDGILFRGFPTVATKLTEWTVSARSRGTVGRSREEDATTDALQSTGMFTDGLVADLSRLQAARFAEMQLLRYGTTEHLRGIQRPPSGIGIQPLLEAKAKGRGVILGCTHIGLYHHALIQAGLLADNILVVTGNQHYSPAAVERLCELSGIEIKIVGANTNASLAIARQLKRGGVVATMLDLYVEETLSMPVRFFGRQAATPAGIFQLAMATGAAIVPVGITTGPDGGKSVEIDSVISSADSVLELATTTNARIEAMIRRHPSTWGAWSSLPKRWRLARTCPLN